MRSVTEAVVVVGSINVDYVVSTDRLPAPGETVIGGTFARHLGGKGANQSVAARRYGAPVIFIGAVGGDAAGTESLEQLELEGIDVSRCSVRDQHATGAAVITVDRSGANQIAVASGANHAIADTFTGVFAELRRGVLLTVFEVEDQVVVSAAEAAAAAGWPVVINPAPARELPERLLRTRPILTPNRAEAEALTGLADPAAAAHSLWRRTGSPVIVTLGDLGALYFDGAEPSTLPAAQVNAVDSTGAGDALNGVLAAGLLDGLSPRDAAAVAVAAASFSTERPGARGGMLSAEMIRGRDAYKTAPLPAGADNAA
jgi:ribokinase